MTQSWYPHSGFRPSPILSACAWSTWLSSSASPYIRSSGITCSASSNNPGFSYFVGVSDREMRRFLNFCDCASAGGVGTLGKLLSDAYDGGVAPSCEPLDVDGLYPDDCDCCECVEAARRLLDDERSLGDGEDVLDRSSSFSRFVRNKPSNCAVNPLAH